MGCFKHIRIEGLFLAFCLVGIMACESPRMVELRGETMGTYYQVKYEGKEKEFYKIAIDSILHRLNLEMSTYIEESFISQFNHSEGGLALQLDLEESKVIPEHFKLNYQAAKEVYQKSGGAFDPTVMPLVNYWGFGYTPKRKVTQIDSLQIDSLRAFVGMEKTLLKNMDEQDIMLKTKAGVQLDFSAIAKGYAVDVIAEWLESNEIVDYLVEIGGELRTNGEKAQGKPWILGINTPKRDAGINDIQAYLSLSGVAMASSGNYRNFYEENGQIFSHTINPLTGYPERSHLLAVSVITEKCMQADAFATACMVLGLERAKELIQQEPGLEAIFFYTGESGEIEESMTEGFKKYIHQ